MKRALVASIPKVESVVQEKFSGAPSQTPSCFAPPIKNPGGATAGRDQNLNQVINFLLVIAEMLKQGGKLL